MDEKVNKGTERSANINRLFAAIVLGVCVMGGMGGGVRVTFPNKKAHNIFSGLFRVASRCTVLLNWPRVLLHNPVATYLQSRQRGYRILTLR